MNYFSNRIKILDVDLRVYISLTVVLSSLMVSMADSMLINQEKYATGNIMCIVCYPKPTPSSLLSIPSTNVPVITCTCVGITANRTDQTIAEPNLILYFFRYFMPYFRGNMSCWFCLLG